MNNPWLIHAREAMLRAQADLDDHVQNRTGNLAEFEKLYKNVQDATAKYAELLRKRLQEKYNHRLPDASLE